MGTGRKMGQGWDRSAVFMLPLSTTCSSFLSMQRLYSKVHYSYILAFLYFIFFFTVLGREYIGWHKCFCSVGFAARYPKNVIFFFFFPVHNASPLLAFLLCNKDVYTVTVLCCI